MWVEKDKQTLSDIGNNIIFNEENNKKINLILISLNLCQKHFENEQENNINGICSFHNANDTVNDIAFFLNRDYLNIDLDNLTKKMKNINTNGSPKEIADYLWADLQKIITHSSKDEILKTWVYGSEFIYVEKCHKNGNKYYPQLPFDASFCLQLQKDIF